MINEEKKIQKKIYEKYKNFSLEERLKMLNIARQRFIKSMENAKGLQDGYQYGERECIDRVTRLFTIYQGLKDTIQ